VVARIPLEGVSRAEGRPVDGTVGFEFFQRYGVEIDYARERIQIHEPGGFAPPQGAIALPVETTQRIPLIDAMVETRAGVHVSARLVVDLGSSSLSLRLAASFVEKHADAFAGVRGIEAPIGAGVGGRLMGEVVRLRALDLGSLRVPEPIVGLARDKNSALEVGLFDGSLGAPLSSHGSRPTIRAGASSCTGTQRGTPGTMPAG
jgi:hypothetical protein